MVGAPRTAAKIPWTNAPTVMKTAITTAIRMMMEQRSNRLVDKCSAFCNQWTRMLYPHAGHVMFLQAPKRQQPGFDELAQR
jgi:hypothetical protein